MQICALYMAVLQILTGCLAPMFYWLCEDTGEALRFARERGVSNASPRLRRMRALHSALCATTPVPWRSLAMLPVGAGWCYCSQTQPRRAPPERAGLRPL